MRQRGEPLGQVSSPPAPGEATRSMGGVVNLKRIGDADSVRERPPLHGSVPNTRPPSVCQYRSDTVPCDE